MTTSFHLHIFSVSTFDPFDYLIIMAFRVKFTYGYRPVTTFSEMIHTYQQAIRKILSRLGPYFTLSFMEIRELLTAACSGIKEQPTSCSTFHPPSLLRSKRIIVHLTRPHLYLSLFPTLQRSTYHFTMVRLATLFFLVASLYTVLAVPVPSNSSTGDSLEQRSQFWGRATFFYVGLGNCGWNSVDSDWVVALSLGSNYDNGAHCGRNVRVNANGVSRTATVVDSCPSCGWGDLDMSPSFFQNFASLDAGVFQMSWDWA
ncbi:hypothetical protein E1B28_002391 [Marasmius oreades]|uniref:RlpA-like double-psi beta-barrel-protein domain-containing protein-containing protein n=1 Tax=Marasmius oreades TaxID=181124 RepID=A0A9P7RN92_9AGAR|nr:uncharacterized protein E1B28_002391 [Marasmius oreades]KAG7086437.1 hypothetical protein E1B28_002391 [Marasmius oreades]